MSARREMINPPISTTVEYETAVDGTAVMHHRNLWWQPGDRIPAHRMETSLLTDPDWSFPFKPEDYDKFSEEEAAAMLERHKEMAAQLDIEVQRRMKEFAVEDAEPVSAHSVAVCSDGGEVKCGRAVGKKAGIAFVAREADAIAQELSSERKEAADDSSEDDFQVSANLPVFTNYNPASVPRRMPHMEMPVEIEHWDAIPLPRMNGDDDTETAPVKHER